MGSRNVSPLFLSNGEENPCPERGEHDGCNEVMHHLTGKLFPQEHDIYCTFQTLVPTHHDLCKSVLIRAHMIKLALNTV